MNPSNSGNETTFSFAMSLTLISIVALLIIPSCFVAGFSKGWAQRFPAPEGAPAMLINGDPTATGKLASFQKHFTPHTPPRTFEYIDKGWYSYSGEDLSKLSLQSHISGQSWRFYMRGQSSDADARQLNYVNAAVSAGEEKNDFVLALSLAQLGKRNSSKGQAQAYRDAAEALLRKGSLASPEKAQILDVLAEGYVWDQHYGAAESCLRRLQPLIAECVGPASEAMAENYNRLAESLGAQGRWPEAEEPLRKAAAIMEVQRTGSLHLDALARCLFNQKKYAEQLGVYQAKTKAGSSLSDSELDEHRIAQGQYTGAPLPLKLPVMPYTDYLYTAEKVTELGEYSDARYYYWEAQRLGSTNKKELKRGWTNVCEAYKRAKQHSSQSASTTGSNEAAQIAKAEELLKHAVVSNKNEAASAALSAARILIELPRGNDALMQRTAAILVRTAQQDIDGTDAPETFHLTQSLLHQDTDPLDVDPDDLRKEGLYTSAAYVLRLKAQRARGSEPAELLHQLAHCYEATGENDKAYNALSQACSLYSSDKYTSKDIVKTLNDMVRCKLNSWKIYDAAYVQGTKYAYETISTVAQELDHACTYSIAH